MAEVLWVLGYLVVGILLVRGFMWAQEDSHRDPRFGKYRSGSLSDGMNGDTFLTAGVVLMWPFGVFIGFFAGALWVLGWLAGSRG